MKSPLGQKKGLIYRHACARVGVNEGESYLHRPYREPYRLRLIKMQIKFVECWQEGDALTFRFAFCDGKKVFCV